jgi:hypothetical protein
VDGVADLSRRNAKSPDISTEIGGAHLRRTLPCAAVCRRYVSHKARRAPSERTRGLALFGCYSLQDLPKDHL